MKTEHQSLRGMVDASMFGALTALGAYIIIPIPPVPITLQTFFLYVAGAILGGYLGALSQVVYILLGIIGLPVFAGGKAGLGVLFGPTGGYLIGFVLAAFLVGKLVSARPRPGFLWMASSMLAGTAALYTLGVLQLMVVAKLSLIKALAVGVLPFLIGDAIKIVLAALISGKVRERIRL